jgi:hypothetical protein
MKTSVFSEIIIQNEGLLKKDVENRSRFGMSRLLLLEAGVGGAGEKNRRHLTLVAGWGFLTRNPQLVTKTLIQYTGNQFIMKIMGNLGCLLFEVPIKVGG